MKKVLFMLMAVALFTACNPEPEPEPMPTPTPTPDPEEEITIIDTFTLHDVDGNLYHAVQIGEQIWMKENLHTTHYADGTPIPAWKDSWPRDSRFIINPDLPSEFGYYYNWMATVRCDSLKGKVPNDPQGVCPDGWHVPSDHEWKQLERTLGMSEADLDIEDFRGTIAAKLCADHSWVVNENYNTPGNPNTKNINYSHFSALAAGMYSSDMFYTVGSKANFWSRTMFDESEAWTRSLDARDQKVGRSLFSKMLFYSVRCVKDEE